MKKIILDKRDPHGVITSTEMPVLFGVEKYKSYYQLLAEKQKGDEDEISGERIEIGTALESTIARLTASQIKMDVLPFKKFVRLESERIGSSFDYKIMQGDKDHALLECKNVDYFVFSDEWSIDQKFGLIAPPHIEIQCQNEMLVYGIDKLYLAALVGGNQLHIARRKRSERFSQEIKQRVNKFWEDIKQPLSDFPVTQKNAAFIISSSIQENTPTEEVIDIDGQFKDLAFQYKKLSEEKSKIDSQLKVIKASILKSASSYKKIKGDTYTISMGQTAEKEIPAYIRKAYRNFRVDLKKGVSNKKQ